jgi:CRISPR-associated protein (TIGR02584 family)
LTETVWALASENPPVVPDRVVVLTTTTGRQALESALFVPASSAWDRLRRALAARGLPVQGRLRFGLAADCVRLFPTASGSGDLDDIATSADNAAAADFMLRELRAWTEQPGTRVLASIAGGRKTMGALLLSCMGLLGRSQDRVLHVLVNPPFDSALEPPFLFPESGLCHKPKDGTPIPSESARIELIDVPFVRMRGWYEDKFRTAPPSYADLVAAVQRESPPPEKPPTLTLDCAKGVLLVDGSDPVRLTPVEFAAVLLQVQGVWRHAEIAERLLKLKTARLGKDAPAWRHDFQASTRYLNGEEELMDIQAAIEALRKTLSSARAKLAKNLLLAPHVERLLPKRQAATEYFQIKISNLKSEIPRKDSWHRTNPSKTSPSGTPPSSSQCACSS